MPRHLLVDLAILVIAVLLVDLPSRTVAADPAIQVPAQKSALRIAQIEPTPLFPKPADGQPMQQLARLQLDNPGQDLAVVVKITVGAQVPETQDLGMAAQGQSVVNIRIPDIAAPRASSACSKP